MVIRILVRICYGSISKLTGVLLMSEKDESVKITEKLFLSFRFHYKSFQLEDNTEHFQVIEFKKKIGIPKKQCAFSYFLCC